MENKALALRDLRQIAHKMRMAGLHSIEFGNKTWHVRLKYASQTAAISPAVSVASETGNIATVKTEAVRAPMPGTVLLQHPLNGLPFTSPGTVVEKDAVLALLKVGLIYLPLRSPVNGTVDSLSVSQGDCVEYGSEIIVLRNAEAAA